MPLYLFYTMVQKSQKWPKTQIKGGPALNTNRTFGAHRLPQQEEAREGETSCLYLRKSFFLRSFLDAMMI